MGIEDVQVQAPTTPKKFIKPSIGEVMELIQNEAQDFFDYYESNGWRVGRNPMRDWKAAARRWAKNQNGFRGPRSQAKTGTMDTIARAIARAERNETVDAKELRS